nr:immunoglobulin light chain junction region [Macaca mulatta]
DYYCIIWHINAWVF